MMMLWYLHRKCSSICKHNRLAWFSEKFRIDSWRGMETKCLPECFPPSSCRKMKYNNQDDNALKLTHVRWPSISITTPHPARYQMFLMALESFEKLVSVVSGIKVIYECAKGQLIFLLLKDLIVWRVKTISRLVWAINVICWSKSRASERITTDGRIWQAHYLFFLTSNLHRIWLRLHETLLCRKVYYHRQNILRRFFFMT